MKIEDLFERTVERLTPFSSTPQLDAQVLLAHILERPRTWVMAHTDYGFTSEQQLALNDSLARLDRGESFPCILGKWEFFGLEFEVTKDVLIPRPETELLVEKAIAWLQASVKRDPSTSPSVADIGTGSGVIAVMIAMHVPEAHILATDISPAALDVARRNAKKLGVEKQIEFVECDLLPEDRGRRTKDDRRRTTDDGVWSAVRGPSSIDLVCANLPYIPTETLHKLPIYGREPSLALDGGSDGLELYRRLFKLAPEWLAPNGMMLLEIEATHGAQTLSLASRSFASATIRLHQDLAGQDRLLEIMLP